MQQSWFRKTFLKYRKGKRITKHEERDATKLEKFLQYFIFFIILYNLSNFKSLGFLFDKFW